MADAGVFTEAIARQTQSCHIYHVDSSVRDVTAAHRLGIPGSCPARGSDGCTVLCSDGTRRLDCVRYGQNESGSRIADGLGAYLASIRCSILKSVELTAAAIFGFFVQAVSCMHADFFFIREKDGPRARRRTLASLRTMSFVGLRTSRPRVPGTWQLHTCDMPTCAWLHSPSKSTMLHALLTIQEWAGLLTWYLSHHLQLSLQLLTSS